MARHDNCLCVRCSLCEAQNLSIKDHHRTMVQHLIKMQKRYMGAAESAQRLGKSISLSNNRRITILVITKALIVTAQLRKVYADAEVSVGETVAEQHRYGT